MTTKKNTLTVHGQWRVGDALIMSLEGVSIMVLVLGQTIASVPRGGWGMIAVSQFVLKNVFTMGTVLYQTLAHVKKVGPGMTARLPYVLRNVKMEASALLLTSVVVSNGKMSGGMAARRAAFLFFKIQTEIHR